MPGSLTYTEQEWQRQKGRDRSGSKIRMCVSSRGNEKKKCTHVCSDVSIMVERRSDCVYLGGVGVAVSSTNRRGVNHRAGFALWPRNLVQTGTFKTRKENQKMIYHLTLSPSQCTASVCCIHPVFSYSYSYFRNETRTGIYMWLFSDLLALCSSNCAVAKYGKWGQYGVTVLCPVCSVPDRHTNTRTHKHTKPIHITWQDFLSAVRQCQCWGNWTKM